MQNKKILFNLRNKINRIDNLILNQLLKRNKIAMKIVKKKIMYKINIQDKIREKELINTLTIIGKKNNLSTKYIKLIFDQVIKNSLAIQYNTINKIIKNYYFNNLRFSYLGPNGSYSDIAAKNFLKIYCKNYIIKQYSNFCDVFSAVINNQSYAIVPLENSYSGLIKPVYNILCQKKLNIIGKFKLLINHYLLSKSYINLHNINIIYSHPESINQCNNFIKILKNIEIRHTNSTSEAMEIVSHSKSKNIAAIGDKINAKLYKLKLISKIISNQPNNNTQFIILSNKMINLPNIIPKETTLILKTKELLLFKIVCILKKQKIHNFEIQSKIKINNINKEIIYLKIKKNIQSSTMKKFFKIIKELKISINVLGCYPILNIK